MVVSDNIRFIIVSGVSVFRSLVKKCSLFSGRDQSPSSGEMAYRAQKVQKVMVQPIVSFSTLQMSSHAGSYSK